MCFADQLFEIVAHQRLATRKPELRRAELARLTQHLFPFVCRQFTFVFRVVQRVVAEHTVQRATIGDLRQQPQRGRDLRGYFIDIRH